MEWRLVWAVNSASRSNRCSRLHYSATVSGRAASTGKDSDGTRSGSAGSDSGAAGNRPLTVQQVVAERNEQADSDWGVTAAEWLFAAHPHSARKIAPRVQCRGRSMVNIALQPWKE